MGIFFLSAARAHFYRPPTKWTVFPASPPLLSFHASAVGAVLQSATGGETNSEIDFKASLTLSHAVLYKFSRIAAARYKFDIFAPAASATYNFIFNFSRLRGARVAQICLRRVVEEKVIRPRRR